MMILDGPNPTPEEFKKWLEEMLEKEEKKPEKGKKIK